MNRFQSRNSIPIAMFAADLPAKSVDSSMDIQMFLSATDFRITSITLSVQLSLFTNTTNTFIFILRDVCD
ncbi:hypothetical protein L9F63_002975, partial [Diploptera punctata]